MEASAQWAQQKAIPGDRSYAAFIPSHLNESWRHMDTRPALGGTGIAYSTLFPFYPIEKLHPGQVNEDIIGQIWERYTDPQFRCGPMKPVIDSVLPQDQWITKIFPDYAEASYFLAYPNEQGTIQGRFGNDFRPARDTANLSEQTLAFAGPPSARYGGVYIDPLGAAYVEFANNFSPGQKDKGRSLQVTVNITTPILPIPPVIKVWTITQFPLPPNAAPIVAPIQLTYQNGAYNGVVLIADFYASQVLRVATEVTNPQTSGSELGDWTYQAQVIVPPPTP